MEAAPRKFEQLFADKVKKEEKKIKVSKGVGLTRELAGFEAQYDEYEDMLRTISKEANELLLQRLKQE